MSDFLDDEYQYLHRKIDFLEKRLDICEKLRRSTFGLHMSDLEQHKYLMALEEIEELTEKNAALELELEMKKYSIGEIL